MLSHYSPSQFVPMKTIGARNLKEVLRKAIAESNGKQSLEVGVSFCFYLFRVQREAFNIQLSPTLRKVGTRFYLTVRLRARVFYQQIVNEAQPSRLSLVENEGE